MPRPLRGGKMGVTGNSSRGGGGGASSHAPSSSSSRNRKRRSLALGGANKFSGPTPAKMGRKGPAAGAGAGAVKRTFGAGAASRAAAAARAGSRAAGGGPAASTSSSNVVSSSSSSSSSSAAAPPPLVVPPTILVSVRVRPENEREAQDERNRNIIGLLDEQILVFDPKEEDDGFFLHGKLQQRRDVAKKVNRNHKFAFDQVFGPHNTNEDVFQKTTKDCVDFLFTGFNCSVFVYGATGAGKTHTMLGSDDNPGLTYRTVMELYNKLEAMKLQNMHCELAVSYLEVYNETVIDLINPGKQLEIRDNGNNGVLIPSLTRHRPDGPEHFLHFLKFGNGNRTQHPTDANAESSRSHAVFQVYLKQSALSGASSNVKVSKLSMIDLAGSERASVTHARGGARLREGANINKSLLALGNCINALAENSKYVPFRNSKLTRLLKDSLGGNCRTVMIANVSPSSLTFEDTYNTLKYADRAKRIKVKLKKNMVNMEANMGQYAKVIDGLKAELEGYKKRVQDLEQENGKLKEQIEQQAPTPETPAAEDITDSPMDEPGVAAADLNQTYDASVAASAKSSSASSPPEATERQRQADLEAQNASLLTQVEELRRQLADSERRNAEPSQTQVVEKEGAGSKELADKEVQSSPAVSVGASPSAEITAAADRHKEAIVKAIDASSKCRRLMFRRDFADRILARSALLAVDPRANARVQRFIRSLAKKLKRAKEQEAQAKTKMDETGDAFSQLAATATDSGGDGEHLRRLLAEMETARERCVGTSLAEMFCLVYEEQERTEHILRRCLPQLKSKHLLLSSYRNSEEEQKAYVDLVSDVQCSKIQFRPDRLVDADDDTVQDRLGPLLSAVTDFDPKSWNGGEDDVDMEDDDDEVDEKEEKRPTETTFLVGNDAGGSAEGDSGENGDATFVMEETDETTTAAVPTSTTDSTFVVDENTQDEDAMDATFTGNLKTTSTSASVAVGRRLAVDLNVTVDLEDTASASDKTLTTPESTAAASKIMDRVRSTSAEKWCPPTPPKRLKAMLAEVAGAAGAEKENSGASTSASRTVQSNAKTSLSFADCTKSVLQASQPVAAAADEAE